MTIHVSATFCVSHGDEMKLISMNWAGAVSPLVPDWPYELISGQMGAHVRQQLQQGLLSENAHLVTHLDDR